ncbi:MAG: ABC transporter permease [Alphaproteobacteria bacterium]|nr:ABC transporter permease [Alphaproteobacteria bacterium]
MIRNAVRIALTEIGRNLTRSLLTALGIMIGVAAVIAMVGLGQGTTASIEADLASMGNNLLILSPGSGHGPAARTPAPPFTARDAEVIAQQVPQVLAIAPTVNASATLVFGGEEVDSVVYGSTRAWFQVMNRELAEGRLPTLGEERAGAAVCVLGETVRSTLFGGESAVGAELRVGKMSCRVIGLARAKGANTMGMDQDDFVFTPMATVQRRLLGTTDVSVIYLSVDHPDHIDVVKEEATALMRQRRHIAANSTDNFTVRDTRELAQMVTGITTVLTAFLGAVAGVSLLVGGIGIMNIMLVSVTERTREIGIRMAVGALERDVLTQFLVEAGMLAAMGGVVGVAVGLLGAWIGARALGVPFVFNLPVTLGAVGFSALVGVVFGWYPARRAARMEPIDALRHT